MTRQSPLCINWTITSNCNYSCKYCFARFPELRNIPGLSLKDQLKIPALLHGAGCEKITFVGGEPLLSPSLPALLKESKDVGMTTMIVTNGSLLTNQFIRQNKRNIDWISLSIDSHYEAVQFSLGRGFSDHVKQTISNSLRIHHAGIRLKVNSVVTKYTVNESMGCFIERLQPDRWKVFQMLPVTGQNDQFVGELAIKNEEFEVFIRNHQHISYAVFENNDMMRGSYVMISPDGRFFSNETGGHMYSQPILKVGVDRAFEENDWNEYRFRARGGIYSWAPTHNTQLCTNTQEVI